MEKNQEGYKALLDLFRTTDEALRIFLFSLKEIPAPMVPELLRTFYREQEKSTYRTFLDVIKCEPVGTLFECVQSGISYQFTGFDNENSPTAVQLGKKEQVYLNPTLKVWRIF